MGFLIFILLSFCFFFFAGLKIGLDSKDKS